MEFIDSPQRPLPFRFGAPVREMTANAVEPMESYDIEEEEDWTSDVYARLNGTRRRHSPPVLLLPVRKRCSVGRVTTALFAALCLLCGVTLLSVCCLLQYQRVTQHVLIPFCRSCMFISVVGAGFGLTLSVIGLLGLRTSLTKEKAICSALVFMVLLFALALTMAAAAGHVTYSLHMGTSRTDVEELWKALIRHRPRLACDLEASLNCSGLSGGRCCVHAPLASPASVPDACYLVSEDDANQTTAYFDVGSLAPVTWPGEVCPSTHLCAETTGTRACDDIIVGSLTSSYVPVLLGLGAGVLLTSIFALVTCRRLAKGPQREAPPAFVQLEY